MPGFDEYSFLSSNGKTDIHVCQWSPEGKPRGIVQIAHGVAEHIGRYDEFARFLTENGFLVAGNDHLGFIFFSEISQFEGHRSTFRCLDAGSFIVVNGANKIDL